MNIVHYLENSMSLSLPRYRTRLKDDLWAWHDKGWIQPDSMSAIMNDIAHRRNGYGVANVAGMLGAIVLCFAAMTFVAANWDDMVRWQRLLVLFGAMWSCYGIGLALLHKGYDVFGQTAVLAGCGMFGACIMLIAQTYHIEGHPPDAVLLWGLGTLLAAGLLRSAAAGALAFGLFTLWSGWEMSVAGTFRFDNHKEFYFHLPFFIAWLGTAALAAWQRWGLGVHMAGLSLLGWSITALTFGLPAEVLIAVALLVMVGAATQAVRPAIARLAEVSWQAVFGYAAVIAASGFWALQLEAEVLHHANVVYGAIGLAAGFAIVAVGRWLHSLSVAIIGYGFFASQMVYIYAKTFGSLIGTAGFFALVGFTLIAIAAFAVWLQVRSHKHGAIS
jgi:uncharacterized membrane protein